MKKRIMDPALGKTISQVILIIAAGLTFLGVWGHWHYSKQFELTKKYRMPIRTGTASISITVNSNDKKYRRYITNNAQLLFGRGTEPLLLMTAPESFGKSTDENEYTYYATVNLFLSDKSIGKPLNLLKESTHINIYLRAMKGSMEVLHGRVICVFNSEIELEIPIIPQTVEDGSILITEDDDKFAEIFSDFKE